MNFSALSHSLDTGEDGVDTVKMLQVIFIIYQHIVYDLHTVWDALQCHALKMVKGIACCSKAHSSILVFVLAIGCDEHSEWLVLFSQLQVPIPTQRIDGSEVPGLRVNALDVGNGYVGCETWQL